MNKTNDPDNQPLSDNDLKRMKRTPQAKIIRRALNLSQQEFAAQFQISIGTLRDWEQNRAEPDGAAKAYLRVIAREPDPTVEPWKIHNDHEQVMSRAMRQEHRRCHDLISVIFKRVAL